jgi:phage FluMu protein Com
MIEVRCPITINTHTGSRPCGKKLAEDLTGSLVIKCGRCKTVVEITRIDNTAKVMV